MLRRLELYEVDIIRLRAVNATKDTELASLRDQLQIFSEVKDAIADLLAALPLLYPHLANSCFSSLRLACSSKHFAHSNLMCGLVLLDPDLRQQHLLQLGPGQIWCRLRRIIISNRLIDVNITRGRRLEVVTHVGSNVTTLTPSWFTGNSSTDKN